MYDEAYHCRLGSCNRFGSAFRFLLVRTFLRRRHRLFAPIASAPACGEIRGTRRDVHSYTTKRKSFRLCLPALPPPSWVLCPGGHCRHASHDRSRRPGTVVRSVPLWITSGSRRSWPSSSSLP